MKIIYCANCDDLHYENEDCQPYEPASSDQWTGYELTDQETAVPVDLKTWIHVNTRKF